MPRPIVKHNVMHKIKNCKDLFSVGDLIICNADGDFGDTKFYAATVKEISGTDIFVQKENGEVGGGPTGLWVISVVSTSIAQIMFVDIAALPSIPLHTLLEGSLYIHNESLLVVVHELHRASGNYTILSKKFSLNFTRSSASNYYSMPTSDAYPQLVKFITVIPFPCSSCGSVHSGSTFVSGLPYCPSCIADNGLVANCCDCQIPHFTHAMVSLRSVLTPTYRCEHCIQIRRERTKVIHQYNYKPEPKFLFLKEEKLLPNKIFLGVEQEVERTITKAYEELLDDYSPNEDNILDAIGTNIIKKFNKKPKWFYLKHDGSLSSGFELVTEPATLQMHKSLNWDKICDFYQALGMSADDTSTCGLHVHVNKDIMDVAHQIRLGYFVNFHRIKMEAISRRKACQWATYKVDGHPIELMNKNLSTERKYEALNWNPENTVEFRLFKGTSDYPTLMATLEFVESCILYTKQTTIELLKEKIGSWKRYKEFLSTCSYEYLLDYLEKRGV